MHSNILTICMVNILFAFSKTTLLFNPLFYSNVIIFRHHHPSQKWRKATYRKISLKTQQLSKTYIISRLSVSRPQITQHLY